MSRAEQIKYRHEQDGLYILHKITQANEPANPAGNPT